MNCNQAFGQYLRILRERKNLSLDDVDSLSRIFTDPIQKGYLSRCENGHQRLAFSKMIALCRIYEVPPEVLVEKMELDLELERIGGPKTDGLKFKALVDGAVRSARKWKYWDGYAYTRAALPLAPVALVTGTMRDKTEQVLVSFMNFSSAAGKLGKYQLALHELRFIESQDGLSQRMHAVLMDRYAAHYYQIGKSGEAIHYSTLAIKQAEELNEEEILGPLYANRALFELDQEPSNAVNYCLRAEKILKTNNSKVDDLISTYLVLADAYITQGRYKSAQQALSTALRGAIKCQNKRHRCSALVHLGDLAQIEHKARVAENKYRDALEQAKQLNDRRLKFIVELRLFKLALNEKKGPSARAIQRRLMRILPNISQEIEEVAEYKAILRESCTRELLASS